MEFISSFDDHNNGNDNLTKVTSPIVESERSYHGFNFFAECDLHELEEISRGEYMTFGMRRKDIYQYLSDISSFAMSEYSRDAISMGSLNKVEGSYKYFPTAYGKEVIATCLLGLQSEILCLYQNWHRYFSTQKFCHFASKTVDK